MNLILTSSLNILLSAAICLAAKKAPPGALSRRKNQLIIGILFGIVTCLSTEYGLTIPGAVINSRDASPLCAGLLFGGPAGIIAGLIGGIHRFFWGTALKETFTAGWLSAMFSVEATGGLTRIACTLGTVCSGFFSALMRKYLFDDHPPAWFYGLALGLTTEVFHLFLVFVFRLNYLSRVFQVIRACTVPMLLANVTTVTASVIVAGLLSGEPRKKSKKPYGLAGAFQVRLLICVLIAFFVTTFGMLLVQYKLGVKQTEATLAKNLADLEKKIQTDGGIEKFIENGFTWHVGNSGGIIVGALSFDENGQPKEISVVLNDEKYSRGEVIGASQMTGSHIYKTADNFFKASIPINGKDTLIYGMYLLSGKEHIIISYVPVEEAVLHQNVTVCLTAFFEVLVFAALFIQIYYLIKKSVVENFAKVNGTLKEITGGNLDAVVNVRSHREFSSLSDDINQTVGTLKHYIAKEAARIDKELEFARTIQHSALPGALPLCSEDAAFQIHAAMDTAKEVGGDFYDYYFVDDGRLAFLIADVSGKGIPAAMFMMTVKTLLKSYAERGLPTDRVFSSANEKLCQNNEAGMFVTAFMCVIDLKTGLVKFANAGHNPPLICPAGGIFEYFRPRPDFVLAGMEGVSYHEGEFRLAPGDTLYLYTDGVTEAADLSRKLYGEDRLRDVLNRSRTESVASLCAKVKEDVDRFAGEAEQFDDITMLAFRYIGAPGEKKQLTVDAEAKNLEMVTDFINTELDAAGCPAKIRTQIDVATDELFANIVNYAYPEGAGKVTVSVELRRQPAGAVLTFADSGIPFNPLRLPDPDTSLSAEDRRIGGLGIFMVKKVMDDIAYEYRDGQNLLTVKKNF